ncbi:MAG: hypothetical protein IM631_16380 [Cytophagales bacterium]|nr:hypothetical protein [Cytophagales bacterium]MCA6367071.1 hypothetical protein [Cytophagales bacterium]MCA6372949.1 hypothetical protein [Cytophagales bacterium]MCA6383301.1 hypothetical protein [Cytophagales bacterium]
MMARQRRLLFFLITLCVLVILFIEYLNLQGTPSFTVAHYPGSLQMNCNIDAAWQTISSDTLSTITFGSEFVESSNDLLCTFKQMWNDEALCLLVTVHDDRIFKPTKIDSAYQWLNEWDTDNVTLFFRRKSTDGGGEIVQKRFICGVHGTEDATDDGTRYQLIIDADKYTLEIALPWSVLSIDPRKDPVYFDIQVTDHDKYEMPDVVASRETNLGLSNYSSDAWKSVDHYAKMILSVAEQ